MGETNETVKSEELGIKQEINDLGDRVNALEGLNQLGNITPKGKLPSVLSKAFLKK